MRAVLQALSGEAEYENVQQIFLSCASLSNASHLLQVVAEALDVGVQGRGEGSGMVDIPGALREFAKSDGEPVLIVVDEVDLLATSTAHAAALYTLFELPASERSRLAVLAIANAVDLPTRLLPWLADSPARPHAVSFAPYDAAALAGIARYTLPALNGSGVPPLAVTLAAKKVAAAGGDARFMLDVCRHTLNKLREGDARSAISIVASAVACKGVASHAVSVIAGLPTHQQLALCVAANAATFSDRSLTLTSSPARPSASPTTAKRKRATLGGLYESFRRMCDRIHVPVVPFHEFADFCSGALSQHALLDVPLKVRGKATVTLASRPVRLRVPVDDVRAAVENKPFLQRLISK